MRSRFMRPIGSAVIDDRRRSVATLETDIEMLRDRENLIGITATFDVAPDLREREMLAHSRMILMTPGEQRFRRRMLRMREHLARIAVLDDLAIRKNEDTLCEVTREVVVMRRHDQRPSAARQLDEC